MKYNEYTYIIVNNLLKFHIFFKHCSLKDKLSIIYIQFTYASEYINNIQSINKKVNVQCTLYIVHNKIFKLF